MNYASYRGKWLDRDGNFAVAPMRDRVKQGLEGGNLRQGRRSENPCNDTGELEVVVSPISCPACNQDSWNYRIFELSVFTHFPFGFLRSKGASSEKVERQICEHHSFSGTSLPRTDCRFGHEADEAVLRRMHAIGLQQPSLGCMGALRPQKGGGQAASQG